MIQTKTIYKLLCYIPYYFILIIIISWYFSQDDLFNPPPPSPHGEIDLPILGYTMSKILLVQVPATIGYLAISFPFVIFLLVHQLRNGESKKMTFVPFLFYIIVIIGAIFIEVIFKIFK